MKATNIKFTGQVKTGSVILFKKKGILPFLIRLISRTNYNHAGIIINFNEKKYVVEAVKEGVRIIPLDRRLNDPRYCLEVAVYEPVYAAFDEKKFWDEIFSVVGANYDYLNLFFTQPLYYLFNIWLGARTEQDALKKMICYEVVYYIHRNTKTFRQHDGKWWKAKVTDIQTNRFDEFRELPHIIRCRIPAGEDSPYKQFANLV